MKSSIIRLVAGAVLWAATAAASEAPAAAEGVPNYTRVSGALAVAGAPSAETAARLKDWGFKTVIDLRTEGEGTAEEKAVVEKLGLRYVSMPMTPATFSLDDARSAAKVLDDPEAGPVLLHCASANRAAGVYAVVQALKGRTVDEAVAAGREAGLKNEAMVEAVRRVAAQAGAK